MIVDILFIAYTHRVDVCGVIGEIHKFSGHLLAPIAIPQ